MEFDELPRLQHLVELRLIDTRLTVSDLDILLRAVGPGLSKVAIRRISPERTQTSWGGEGIIQFSNVVASLQPWRNTLKELTFIMYGNPMPRRASELVDVELLREFHALEVLRVQAGCLAFYGQVGQPGEAALTSTLPKCVRELRLYGYTSPVPGLQGLLGSLRAGQFKGLRRLGIDDQHYEKRPEMQQRAEELKEVGAGFRSVGVDFVVLDGDEYQQIEDQRLFDHQNNGAHFDRPVYCIVCQIP
jgi:hypothetical protein